MNLLLDTHVWLWWLSDSPELRAEWLEAINVPDNRIFVSAVSLWEANIKRGRGKLRVDGDLARGTVARGLEFIAFTERHADAILPLPQLHKDPFDRALIAQAKLENLILMTEDRLIRKYEGLRLFPSTD